MTNVDRRPVLSNWAASALLILAAVAASATILMLAHQNRQLTGALASPQEPPRLEVGGTLPDIRLVGLAGEAGSLHALAESGFAVVGFMTTTCKFCELNLPYWRELVGELAAAKISFDVLSLDSANDTKAYGEEHHVDWPIWIPDPAGRRRLPPMVVPTTVVLARDGEVIAAVSGVRDQQSIVTIAEQAMTKR